MQRKGGRRAGAFLSVVRSPQNLQRRWARASGSVAWGMGASFRNLICQLPGLRGGKQTPASLALNVRSPLQPSGCCDIDAACANSAGWDCG